MVIDEANKDPRVKRIIITSQWRLPLLLDGNYATSEALTKCYSPFTITVAYHSGATCVFPEPHKMCEIY